MKALGYVEIDVPYCSLVYGTLPCTAAIDVDHPAKCFNTIASCQDRGNFTDVPVTLRFAVDTGYNPTDIEAIPAIKAHDSIRFTPGRISLGENLGQRAELSIAFDDLPWADTGPGFDKYVGDRGYDAFKRGSFFGKMRARQPFLQGRPLRLIRGFVGQSLADMETRHYVIEHFNGPDIDGRYTIVAIDILQLLEGDRAQAPRLSGGFLNAGVSDSATSLTLSVGTGGLYYGDSGKVAIAGKEIVSYTRDRYAGNDANTKLLLHGDGSDTSTTFTDSSASGRTVTAVGNAQLDTAQKKFGSASLLFDGTGDYATVPDSADWTFAGDFTVDLQGRFNSLAATCALFSHSTDANNQYRLYATTGGALTFEVKSSGTNIVSMASAAGIVATGQFYHFAVVRSGNVWTIYLDGVAVATTTDSDAIPNFTSTFRIGADGGAVNVMNGWIDEFRVSSVARWTAAFAAPVVAYDSSSDKLTLTGRGLNGTTAQAHDAQDRVQECAEWSGADVANIASDLMTIYAGVDSSYIPLAEWLTETAAHNRQLYSGIIAEPTSVKKLLTELVRQAGLAIWWDDINQEVRLQVLRAIATDAGSYDDTKILTGTFGVVEQPDKRLSEIWTYFAQISPLGGQEDPSNYRCVQIDVEADAEADYGTPAIIKIFSRWIPYGGRSIASRLNVIQLGRYRDPPRKIKFDLLATPTEAIELGGGYKLLPPESRYWPLQEFDGSGATLPFQVTRERVDAARLGIEGEEANFLSLDTDDLSNRTISLDADANTLTLRAIHDAIYPTPVIGDVVTFNLLSNVIIGADSSSVPAIDTGTWPTVARTGNRTNGSPILTGLSSTSGFTPGMGVTGTGIPAGSKILTVDSGTQITLDHNASSGAGTPTALTIYVVRLILNLDGRLQGAGGKGGRGANGTGDQDGENGAKGGTALKVRAFLELVIGSLGKLWSGGGGGGGGGTRNYDDHKGGGGGGGGGRAAGGGGTGPGGGEEGHAGTLDAGGSGGRCYTTNGVVFHSPSLSDDHNYRAGNGGDPGENGSAGDDIDLDGGNGGAKGDAIDGVSLVVLTNGGSIKGTQV